MPAPRTRCNCLLTAQAAINSLLAAGEKALKKLRVEAQSMPAMQMAFDSVFAGVPRIEPLHERRPLVASNLAVAAAMPLPVVGGCGSWPFAAEAPAMSAARAPVLACVVRTP